MCLTIFVTRLFQLLAERRIDECRRALKEEMRHLGSLVMDCADRTRLPAGGALAVDRTGFSGMVTDRIRSHPLIMCVTREQTDIRMQGHHRHGL